MPGGSRPKVLDVLRRRYVTLTPEEWVRQHFVHYLMQYKGYPASLMANEVLLHCGAKQLRADTVVYSRKGKPVVIIEYKAPHITIGPQVVEQAAAYNLLLQVDWLIVSNGLTHHCFKLNYETKQCVAQTEIPDYDKL